MQVADYGIGCLGAVGGSIEIRELHAARGGVGEGGIQRQVFLAANHTDGSELPVVADGGSSADVVRIGTAERQQRVVSEQSRRRDVVLQLAPLVSWDLRIDEVVTFQEHAKP